MLPYLLSLLDDSGLAALVLEVRAILDEGPAEEEAIDRAAEAIASRIDGLTGWGFLGPAGIVAEAVDALVFEEAARWLLKAADEADVVAEAKTWLRERADALLARWQARGGVLGRLAERLSAEPAPRRTFALRAAGGTPGALAKRIVSLRGSRRAIPGVFEPDPDPVEDIEPAEPVEDDAPTMIVPAPVPEGTDTGNA